jgi:polyphosphate kinase 2 (PPK2 family)
LHISKEEQRKRLEERTQDPKKQWKYDPQDLIERAHWPRYQELYAAAINETNAEYAPWYIIPADSKTKRNLAIAQIVVEKLENLKLSYPPPNPALNKIKIE